MFGLGIPELIVIFVIALLVFGPRKLPDLGKSIGRAMAEFKKAQQEFQESVQAEMKDVEKTADLEGVKKLAEIDHPAYHKTPEEKQGEGPGAGGEAEPGTEQAKGGEIKGNG
jgi:sec-independent protein translocase protein TatA